MDDWRHVNDLNCTRSNCADDDAHGDCDDPCESTNTSRSTQTSIDCSGVHLRIEQKVVVVVGLADVDLVEQVEHWPFALDFPC